MKRKRNETVTCKFQVDKNKFTRRMATANKTCVSGKKQE